MTSERAIVSVVIPCLNRAPLLVPTIESVLKQDYDRIECIVVDGGSHDRTIEILKGYGDRIKWVSEPDQGQADAINKGWRMSRGDIIAWLNADDLWVVPDAVSKVVSFLDQHPEADVVYGDCGSIDADGNLVGMSYLHEWDLEYAVEHCDHCIPQPAAFLRRRILEKAGMLDTDFHDKMDHEYWLRVGLSGGCIRHLPVVLAQARSLPDDTSHRWQTALTCVRLTKKFFRNPELPQELVAKKRRSLSNSYIRGMQYAFAGGRLYGLIARFAFCAALADPRNARRALQDLRWYLEQGAIDRRSARWMLRILRFATLPRWAFKAVSRRLRGERLPRCPNLIGDREVEWSWVAAHMPAGPGDALDFGCGGGDLGLVAAQKGFQVTAVDLGPIEWPYRHPKLTFLQGDILKLPLSREHYDLVINCSAIEHVGLVGRYAVTESRPDGDLEAMRKLADLMKPGGIMLLTIPIGQDAVFAPLTRIYGAQRLPKVLAGFDVAEEEYWVKNAENRWTVADKQTALDFKASAGSWDAKQNIYALGFLALRKPGRRMPAEVGSPR